MKYALAALLIMCVTMLCATPSWYKESSNSTHIIGNGTAQIKGKDTATAERMAREDALYNIATQISSAVRSSIATVEQQSGEYDSFYRKETMISSCVDLCGAELANRAVEKDKIFVQYKVSREKLRDYYLQKVENLIEQAHGRSIQATESESRDNKTAIRLWKEVRQMWDELQRDAMILGYLDTSAPIQQKLSQIPRLGEVETAIQRLTGNPLQSFEDLAEDIIEQLPPEFKTSISSEFAFYQWADTGFSSQVSADFSQFLKNYLQAKFRWKAPDFGELPQVTVSGEFLPAGDQICVITRLTQPQEAQTLITYMSPATIAKLGMNNIIPADLENKLKEQQLLLAQAKQSGNLRIEVKSGEYGTEPAVYKLGQNASIYVRANLECYATLVYLEADGTKCVLMQNFFIPEDKTNTWVKIPTTFQAVPPIGIEQVWVQANIKELPEIPTQWIGEGNLGKNVALESLGDTIKRSRGMAIEKRDNDFSEAFLTWTILN